MPFTHRLVVGISGKAVTNSPNVVVSTYALGSCIALVGYDPVSKVGGMIHFMLADSKRHSDHRRQPCMFADTGIPLLMDDFRALRGIPSRMRWCVIGAAAVIGGQSFFTIGKDNIDMTRRILADLNLPIYFEDVGGCVNRTVHLLIAKAKVQIKLPDVTHELDLV